MKLPKLYRVVYVEIEYCIDHCYDGVHTTDEGEYYTKAHIVIDKSGLRRWKFLDKDFTECPDYKYVEDGLFIDENAIDFNWCSVDKRMVEIDEKYKHSPYNNWDRPTIKEQKQWNSEFESICFPF